MNDTPREAQRLVPGHALTTFFPCGDGEGVGKGKGGSWRWLEEDLVRYTAVFILVPSSLANILWSSEFVDAHRPRIEEGLLTDLVIGDVANDVG